MWLRSAADTGLALLLLAAMPVAAAAQEALKAGAIIGMEVRVASSGERGRVEDLVVDIANSRVHYAVIGLAGRMLTQPLGTLEFSADKERAQVREITEEPVAPRAGMALARASELLGWKFESQPGIALGRVVNLLIDPKSGAIAFAVVRLNDARAAPLRAVPLEAFAIHPLRENLVLTIDAGRLKEAPGFRAQALEGAGFVAQYTPAARALAPGAGRAASGATGAAQGTFTRLDRNGDGFLSDRELERPAAERRNWLAIDLNRDGRISRAEFEAMRAPMRDE